MYKTQYMDQCSLGAGRHHKYLHSSNFNCTNLHMRVVFRALNLYITGIGVAVPQMGRQARGSEFELRLKHA